MRARPEVALQIRTIRANTNTEHFPELDWVLREKGHVLVFCPSIRAGFRPGSRSRVENGDAVCTEGVSGIILDVLGTYWGIARWDEGSALRRH